MCPPWGGTTKMVLAFAEKASVGKAGESFLSPDCNDQYLLSTGTKGSFIALILSKGVLT